MAVCANTSPPRPAGTGSPPRWTERTGIEDGSWCQTQQDFQKTFFKKESALENSSQDGFYPPLLHMPTVSQKAEQFMELSGVSPAITYHQYASNMF